MNWLVRLLVLWLLMTTCWLPGCRSSGPSSQPGSVPAGEHSGGWVFLDANGVPGVWMPLEVFLYYENCRIWRLAHEE